MSKNSFEIVGWLKNDVRPGRILDKQKMVQMTVEIERHSGQVDSVTVEAPEEFAKHSLCREGPVHIKGRMDSYNVDRHLIMLGTAEEIGEPENGMADVNQVEFEGYVCREPKYRVTPRGMEITDLMLAISQGKDKACAYMPCIAWGKTARIAGYLKVGERMHIQGRWQSRDYTKTWPDGRQEEKRTQEISIYRMTWADKITEEAEGIGREQAERQAAYLRNGARMAESCADAEVQREAVPEVHHVQEAGEGVRLHDERDADGQASSGVCKNG